MRIGTSILCKRLRLVDFEEVYLTEIYLSWLRNSQVNRYLVKPSSQITFNEARSYCLGLLESSDNYFLAILHRQTGRHIGNVRLGPVDRYLNTCRYSMMLGDTQYHGKGYGTEIVASCLAYCFETLGFRRVHLEVVRSNIAAVRLYEKSGFTIESVKEKGLVLDGEPHDLYFMTWASPIKENMNE